MTFDVCPLCKMDWKLSACNTCNIEKVGTASVMRVFELPKRLHVEWTKDQCWIERYMPNGLIEVREIGYVRFDITESEVFQIWNRA